MVKLALALMVVMSEGRRMETSHGAVVPDPDPTVIAAEAQTESLDVVVDSATGPDDDPVQPSEDTQEPGDVRSDEMEESDEVDATAGREDAVPEQGFSDVPVGSDEVEEPDQEPEMVDSSPKPAPDAVLRDADADDVSVNQDASVEAVAGEVEEQTLDEAISGDMASTTLDDIAMDIATEASAVAESNEDAAFAGGDLAEEEGSSATASGTLDDPPADKGSSATASGSSDGAVEDWGSSVTASVVLDDVAGEEDSSATLSSTTTQAEQVIATEETTETPEASTEASTEAPTEAPTKEPVLLGTSEAPKPVLPIPTPEEYEWNMDLVNGCYNHGSSLKSDFNVDNLPPGYKAKKGQKCGGDWIEYWSDGEHSGYGSPITDVLSCAKICNRHEECAGFYSHLGVCTHFRSGATALQDTEGTAKAGYNCFVKWEARDLHAEAPAVEPDWSDFEAGTIVPPAGKQVSDCLCVWDIDRTLTAKQGWHGECAGTKHYDNIKDYAYTGGTLVLSELAQNIRSTFCGQCYFGVVSAGTASGPNSPNRDMIDDLVDSQYNVGDWVDGCPIPTWGTKVLCCDEGHYKKQAVTDIVGWLASHDIDIKPEKVHFFDDKANNIEAMGAGEAPHYNGHMVSCASRDSSRGGCGGLSSEVVNTTGLTFCSDESADGEKDEAKDEDKDKDKKSASCRLWPAAAAALTLLGTSIM